MPTIRSLFSFEQFEDALQKLAHKVAMEAVRKMNQDVRIVIHNGRFTTVETDNVDIYFRGQRIGYIQQTGGWTEWWSFEIEEKIYLTSNDRTKISFKASENEKDKVEAKIRKFIDNLMTDVKPNPRFSLTNHARKSNRKLTDYKAFSKKRRKS